MTPLAKILYGFKIIGIGLTALFGGIFHGNLLGTATITNGNNYPTSTYTFNDNDIINAGDFNSITTYAGIRSATDTLSLQGQIYNISSTVNTSAPGGVQAVSHGGTGQVATGTAGQVLTSNGNGTTSWGTPSTVAGSSTQIQFNDGGAQAATSTFTYTSSSKAFTTNGTTAPSVAGPQSVIASSTSFSFSGSISSWTIPANVASATINVKGAGGATANCPNYANGGSVTGTLSVTPGTTYWFNIGGKGQGTGFLGGYNGGGDGISAQSCGGTGMTWFSATSTFSTSTVLLVGGGVGGETSGNGGSGAAGLPNGATGGNGAGTGGTGGTQTAGGVTGGSAGQGGSATLATQEGGGGGGYFGGGAGQAGNGAGGGGSSFISSSFTATSSAASSNATGSISINYFITTPTSIVGTNNAGLVTAATTTTTSTITFSLRWGNPPACWITPNNATTTYFALATTSTLAITFDKALSANQSFNYACLGY